MPNLLDRITIDDEVCNGRPTIRGYRLTVQTVLEFILAGTPDEELFEAYLFLEIAATAFIFLLNPVSLPVCRLLKF